MKAHHKTLIPDSSESDNYLMEGGRRHSREEPHGHGHGHCHGHSHGHDMHHHHEAGGHSHAHEHHHHEDDDKAEKREHGEQHKQGEAGHSHSHGHSHADNDGGDDAMPDDFSRPDLIAKLENPERDAYHHWERLAARLAHHAGRSDGSLVGADLGGGTGYVARKLLSLSPALAPPLAARLYSCDPQPQLVQWAREKASERPEWAGKVLPVQCAPDAVELPERVDFLLCVNVLHHLPDPGKYFAEIRRVCKPGCVLLVVDYRPERLERNGEEFGPKMAWGVKMTSERLTELIAGEWQPLEVLLFEYHYNAFFRLK